FGDGELVTHPRGVECYGPSLGKDDWFSSAATDVGCSERCQSGWNRRSGIYVIDTNAFRSAGLCNCGGRRRFDYRAVMYVTVNSILLVCKILEGAASPVTMPSNKRLQRTRLKLALVAI